MICLKKLDRAERPKTKRPLFIDAARVLPRKARRSAAFLPAMALLLLGVALLLNPISSRADVPAAAADATKASARIDYDGPSILNVAFGQDWVEPSGKVMDDSGQIGTPDLTYYDSDGYALGSKPVEPGTYTAKLSWPGDANYEAAPDVTMTIVIIAADTYIYAYTSSIDTEYGRDYEVRAQLFSAESNSPIDDIELIPIYRDSNGQEVGKPKDAGMYTAVFSWGGSDRYAAAETVEVPILIRKTQAYIIIPSGVSGHTTIRAGETVNYPDAPIYSVTEGFFAKTRPSFTAEDGTRYFFLPSKAGNYTVTWKYEGSPNHIDAEERSVLLTITAIPTSVALSAHKVEASYGQPVPEVSEAVIDDDGKTVEGARVSVRYTDADGNVVREPGPGTPVGTYYATYSYAGDDMHAASEATVEIEISKAPIDLSGISLKDATYVYTGQSHALEVTGTLPEGVTGVTYEGNSLTHPGTTVATASFAVDSNHIAPAPLSATLTILPAKQTISVDNGTLALEVGHGSPITLAGVAEGSVVTWSSSDESVVTVDEDGTVVAHRPGTATISAVASATGDYLESNEVSVRVTVADTGAEPGGGHEGAGSEGGQSDSHEAADQQDLSIDSGGESLPQTGDPTNPVIVGALGLAGAAVCAAALVERRRGEG